MRAALASTLLLALPLLAQDRPDPEAQLQAKLASPFLANADWAMSLEAARATASARDQLIFGYFTTAGP